MVRPLREVRCRSLHSHGRIETKVPFPPKTQRPPPSSVGRARRSRSNPQSGFPLAFSLSPLLYPDSALFYFFVAAPEILRHRIFTRHALQSPHRESGSFSGQTQTFFAAVGGRGQECPRYIFSAARIFSLRDRGLRSISSSDAVCGFFVSKRKYLFFIPSRKASFTMRSSNEWKLITTTRPPGFSTRGVASSSAFRSSSSRFTNIRRA